MKFSKGSPEQFMNQVKNRIEELGGSMEVESSEAITASEIDMDKLYSIADRYTTTDPVSGDWSTEAIHEQKAIADEFGISMDEAKDIMITELGFSPDDFGSVEAGCHTDVESACNTANIAAPATIDIDEDEKDTILAYDEEYDDYADPMWEQLETKKVLDRDGFYTDYTLYVNEDRTKWICIHGDRDYYPPDEVDADYESDDESAAYDWFYDYNGFEDDLD